MVEDNSFNNTIEFKTNVTKFDKDRPKRSCSQTQHQIQN